MTKREKAEIPTAMRLLQPARATREKMAGDGHDFAPMVLFSPRRGQAVLAVLDGDGRLHEMLADTLMDMRSTLGPAEWIAVTSDCYVKPTPEPEVHEPGTLAKQFADGDLEVAEQMVVILKRRGLPAELAAQAYRYLPSEGWEWDDPEEITDYSGPVSDVLNHYI